MLEVTERGRTIAFSFDDILKYHGGGSPGGAAIAFKALERALPLLDPDGRPERREIVIDTAFRGPGARDAFECVTCAVSDDRYRIDRDLERPEIGHARERFVFRISYRANSVTLVLRDGFVSDEFIGLARTDNRDGEQEARLDALKRDLAERVMAAPAGAVFDL
jgi:hypothetical protein